MAIREALLNELADTTRQDRANLCEECVRIIYEFVKFQDPEGGGRDGRDGPERRALAKVLDAAIGANDQVRLEKMG